VRSRAPLGARRRARFAAAKIGRKARADAPHRVGPIVALGAVRRHASGIAVASGVIAPCRSNVTGVSRLAPPSRLITSKGTGMRTSHVYGWLALAGISVIAACSGASPTSDPVVPGSPTPSSTSTSTSGTGGNGDGGATTMGDAAPPPSSTTAPTTPSPPSSGTIGFHLLLGVAGSDTPGDSITLDGDNYTDLMMSNFIAGVMYGHLIKAYSPGMTFDADYLYGSIFAQLLQENLATEDYVSTSSLLDPSPDQQAVMGEGQGGPYQINNYAADMVYGSYQPQGYSLINYVTIQKNIGYAFADAATQYTKDTPAPFNDKYFGPMLTAYFHFNDYVALQRIGPVGGYMPAWEPDYDDALATFESLPNNFLEIVLNAAYNQGYYGPLVSSYSRLGATATTATLTSVDSYASVWGMSDTYQQYPYQVRYYLDQIYDNPIPTTSPSVTMTPSNHVNFGMAGLSDVFGAVFAKLAYVDPSAGYSTIDPSKATAAFASASSLAGVASDAALDLSQAADRAKIFAILDGAITNLETTLGTSFIARSTTAL
jgi:hypothetical protein